MDDETRVVVNAFQERFGAELVEFRGEVTLVLPPQQIVAAALAARDEYGYNMLMDATAVDYWPAQAPRFHVVYQLYGLGHNRLLRLRVPVDGNAPVVPTIVPVYPNANWKEREIWDMFGIRFEGHPDLRRILMPEDWQGHPLRKDYPLGYEEPQFSFNHEQILSTKLHPKE
ncbi:MAG TPA: NADH-quinone oxidoreductase subunit C [Anaerolineaceae bacterium]|nr:NADH-quinone oxidoreductase subunit C [Anaerolineaceae bacterium]HQO97485.1 NADH-quinone oxidoreductase subunit C [Anaerolineaceae bacterium]HQP61190.1 NADH-quinone oxidoreductase subunit C [Anaerolineaceae bacterium]